MSNRTIYDLSEYEYERYEQCDPDYDDVTENSINDAYDMMGIDPYED